MYVCISVFYFTLSFIHSSFLAIVVHGSSRGRRPLDPGLVQLLLLMFLHVVESLVSKVIVDDVGKHLILA